MGDRGEADPRLAAALDAWTAQPSPAARAEVLAALAGARVLVPITATSTAEHEVNGLRADSSAEMALLTLVAADGRRALPVFLDVLGLRRWRMDARPVPVTGPDACRGALEDGAVGLVVDGRFTAGEDELRALASGWVPVPGAALEVRRTTEALTDPGEVDRALVRQLRRAVKGEPPARLLRGPDGLVLGFVVDDPAELAAVAARVAQRVTIDVAGVPPHGPGLPLTRRGR